ncbi:hypothetical protein [Sporolactobacillus sp. KGMB 08714]|uniref:hypothetical protein n=1 Tax=Sporolactobacillus sp. KGMB 08714 TaxID=3064704 RepID=UPI002FBE6DC9
MKKFRLWQTQIQVYGEHALGHLLIAEKDIEPQYVLGEQAWLFPEIDVTKVNTEKLGEAYQRFKSQQIEYDLIDKLHEFFETQGYPAVEPESAPAYMEKETSDQLVFDAANDTFFALSDAEIVETYRQFDSGRNEEIIERPPDFAEEIVEVSDDFVNLDEWNGSDWQTGGVGEHERAYKVLTRNGQLAEDEDYLLEKWSQWQGEDTRGKVLSLNELKVHLLELDRDVDANERELKQLASPGEEESIDEPSC